MFSHDDILTPLAVTVIIDTHIRDPELNEFCSQAEHLINLFSLPTLSNKDLRKWFNDNLEGIRGKLNGPRKNTFILRALTRFTDDLHVENLYDAMVSISVSDQEYRREESELIKSAASIWGYRRPPIKVVD